MKAGNLTIPVIRSRNRLQAPAVGKIKTPGKIQVLKQTPAIAAHAKVQAATEIQNKAAIINAKMRLR